MSVKTHNYIEKLITCLQQVSSEQITIPIQLRVSITFYSCSYSKGIIAASYLSRKQLPAHYLALPSLITSYYPGILSICKNRRLEADECFS